LPEFRTASPGPSRPLRVAVFASGRGSNFAALIKAQVRDELSIDIVALFSDRSTAPALELARAAGIEAIALKPRDYASRADFDRAIFDRAAQLTPDLIVLADCQRCTVTLIGEVAQRPRGLRLLVELPVS